MATSWRNKKNYPLGTGSLSADITNSTLSIALNTGQGANFPSATFTITIDEEIILIDSRSTDTLTVNASGRGYDSTTASAHAAQAGVYQYQIVKDFTDLETAVNGIENGTTTLAKVVTSGSAANTMTLDDSGTNTVVTLLALYHTSSGTPASGLGAKLVLGAENSTGVSTTAAEAHGYLTTVTNGAEVGAVLLRLINAGALETIMAASPTSLTLFNNGSASRTISIGNTSSVDAHTTIELICGKNGFHQTLAFKDAGTIKWRVRKIYGTDNLRIYSDTNAADLVTWSTTGESIAGNLTLSTAGNGLLIKEGTNATMGTATLVAGTVTVSTTKVTASSRVFLTVQTLGTVAVAKAVAVTARSAGTSFTITSADATDTSAVAWLIVEPA